MSLLSMLYKRYRVTHSKQCFMRNAVVGKHFYSGAYSLCDNRTGNRNNIIVGNHCFVFGSLIVQGEGEIQIGDNVYIGGDTMIGAVGRVEIGKNVIISSNCRIMDNNNHPIEADRRRKMSESHDYRCSLWGWTEAQHIDVVIEENVWIGEFASVMKGVHIGKGSVIGAHSVVTKDIPAYSLAVGNPAHVVKELVE